MNETGSAQRETSEEFKDDDLAEALPAGSRGRQWLTRLRRTRHKTKLLFLGSFLESTVVPVPIEVVLIPYMAAEPRRIWRIATVTLLGCLLGALIGYGIGYFLFASLGQQIVAWADWHDELAAFRELFAAQGFWAIIAVGVLPIPFQVAMLAAGAAAYPLAWFVLAPLIARGLRYYGLAWLVRRYGRAALKRWQRHKLSTSLILGGAVLALWALLQGLGSIAGSSGASG